MTVRAGSRPSLGRLGILLVLLSCGPAHAAPPANTPTSTAAQTTPAPSHAVELFDLDRRPPAELLLEPIDNRGRPPRARPMPGRSTSWTASPIGIQQRDDAGTADSRVRRRRSIGRPAGRAAGRHRPRSTEGCMSPTRGIRASLSSKATAASSTPGPCRTWRCRSGGIDVSHDGRWIFVVAGGHVADVAVFDREGRRYALAITDALSLLSGIVAARGRRILRPRAIHARHRSPDPRLAGRALRARRWRGDAASPRHGPASQWKRRDSPLSGNAARMRSRGDHTPRPRMERSSRSGGSASAGRPDTCGTTRSCFLSASRPGRRRQRWTCC